MAEVNESALARHPIQSAVDSGIEALNYLLNKHKMQQAMRVVTPYIPARSEARKLPAIKIKYLFSYNATHSY